MIRPRAWTIHQISGAGCVAALLALFLWLFYAGWPEIVRFPFIAALTVTAGCGLIILLITLRDLKHRPGRGSRLRPIRTFDLLLGLALSVPSIIELRAILPDGLFALGF